MEIKINIQREVLEDQVRNIIADNPNISMMDLLIQFGADPKSFGYSIYEIITMTPGMAGEVLIEEFEKDNPDEELIKNILQHSPVDVNMIVKPRIDMTALMWASGIGDTEIVKLLLERPETDVNLQGRNGWTALMVASRMGRKEIVKLLLERPEIDVNMQDYKGWNALTWASDAGFFDIATLLKEHSK